MSPGILMENKLEKADYRKIAMQYDYARTLSEENMARWLALISERASREHIELLDLGCGTGRFAIPFATELNYSVTAVDASADMIARAKVKGGAERVKWVASDVNSLSFPDFSFDVVFMSHLLHHLDQPFSLIERCFRLLRPGGVLINRYGALEHIADDPEHRFFPMAKEIDELRTPTVRTVETWFRKAGLIYISSYTMIQQTDRTAEDRVKRAATRVSSVFDLMPDEEFDLGLEEMKRYATTHADDPWMLTDKLTLTSGKNSY